jgi:metalloprotease
MKMLANRRESSILADCPPPKDPPKIGTFFVLRSTKLGAQLGHNAQAQSKPCRAHGAGPNTSTSTGIFTMNRRDLITGLPTLAAAGFAIPAAAQWDAGKLLGAAVDGAKALTLTDDDVRSYASQMAKHMDSKATIAPAGNKYATRLSSLSKGLETDNNLRLNYKVYMVKDVNAFAMADGTIRLYAGLMDMMTDDEIRYVIGHEIGHVNHGHTKKRMQTALATSAAQKTASASGSRVGQLADTQLGDLVAKVVMSQHSQGNEREADDYALQFMGRRKYDKKAAVSALEKLDKLSGGGGSNWLSTHPSPRERANRMKSQLA